MKKVKNHDKTLVTLIVGVILMLALTIMLSYAYFTAKATSQDTTLTFGVLQIDTSDEGLGKFEVKGDEIHAKIVPGCTLNMVGTIKLTNESVDAFIRMKPDVAITLKDDTEASQKQVGQFVTLFNKAFTKEDTENEDDAVWKIVVDEEGQAIDDDLYYAGKFTNGEIDDPRVVKSFNLADANFVLTATDFGNEWQGATVTINLTVQAIQASHMNLDDLSSATYADTQLLAIAIACVSESNEEVWTQTFNEEVQFGEITNLSFSEINSVDGVASVEDNKLISLNDARANGVNLMAETNTKVVEVRGSSRDLTNGEIDIPSYVRKNEDKWEGCYGNRLNKYYKDHSDIYKVVKIVDNAFTDVSGDTFTGYDLTSVMVPTTVTSIGDNAFNGCTTLTEVKILDGVKSRTIGNHAFDGCTSLKNVLIPNSVISVGDYAFNGCTGLVMLEILDGERDMALGSSVFAGCVKLEKVLVPGCISSIKDYTFAGCSELKEATLLDGLTSIGNHAFDGCIALTTVTVPTTTNVGDYAFNGCTGMTSLTILYDANIDITLGEHAFDGCTGLASLLIFGNVKSIGAYAFNGCTGLTSLTLFAGITSIGDYAFWGCDGLPNASVVIPASVTS